MHVSDTNTQSMAWLLRSYFLPALNPSAPSQAQSTALRPLAPILKLYKSLLKITSRDTSLQKQYKAEIQAVQRDIERWVAEGKVAAKIIVGDLGWDSRTSFDTLEDDHKERWALERLCDGLLEKGALVPLSKKLVGSSSTECNVLMPVILGSVYSQTSRSSRLSPYLLCGRRFSLISIQIIHYFLPSSYII